MSTRQSIFRATALVAATFLLACSGPVNATSFPSTPDGTVEAVSKALADNRPEVLWEAMPPSYRNDLNEVTHLFATKVDPELWSKAFTVMQKAVGVFKSKKEYILASSFMQQNITDPERASASYDAVVELLDTLMNSEISSLDQLGSIDWGTFLAGTGRKLMVHAATISKASPEDPFEKEFKGKLEGATFELVESTDTTATVKVSAPDEESEEIQLVMVEDRWVPKDMADEWDTKMEEARTQLTAMDNEETKAQTKMQGMMALGMAEAFVDQLAAVNSTEEFEAAVGGMFGGLLGGAQGMGDDMDMADEEAEEIE